MGAEQPDAGEVFAILTPASRGTLAVFDVESDLDRAVARSTVVGGVVVAWPVRADHRTPRTKS